MPDAEAIALVYDLEAVCENALKAVFAANQIQAFTTQDIGVVGADGNPVIDFQKARPRVEIMFVPGAGQGRFREMIVDGIRTPVETCWKGQFKLDLITDARINIHAAFRTFTRFLMQTMVWRINGTAPMEIHKIQRFPRDGGTSPVMKPQDGYLQTTMLYDVDLSVQDNAWAALET